MTGRVAILSLHSHGERSFLDDASLALLSGDLRRESIDNDLVVAVLDAQSEAPTDSSDFDRLVCALGEYDVVIYERVWSRRVAARLRELLPGKTFIHCTGEHELEHPPADYLCRGEFREVVPALFSYLRGDRKDLPPGAYVHDAGGFRGRPYIGTKSQRPWEPNLDPRIVNADVLPAFRTFSIEGNHGCPYQSDARHNPLYANTNIPDGFGLGCAFCVTGNEYEASTAEETVDRVLTQLRYVRRNAPGLEYLVLKDQNPFPYLADLIDTCLGEQLGGFTLLLETRADWFLRSQRRLERALATAVRADVRISPFLVGVENFSQAELDRFNKGTTSETLMCFVDSLWAWKERFPETLDLEHASHGFILLSPWTTFEDLRINYEAVKQTGFNRLRGALLVSRVRLYPDTALYYLAERDGLLAGEYGSAEEDSAKRYGYFPARPWRFVEPDVEHFANLAAELHRSTGGRDELSTWCCLLEAFEAADHYSDVDVGSVLDRLRAMDDVPEAGGDAVPARCVELMRPLSEGRAFAAGWRTGKMVARGDAFVVHLEHPREPGFRVEVRHSTDGPGFRKSRHYSITYQGRSLNPSQERALRAVCSVVAHNDP